MPEKLYRFPVGPFNYSVSSEITAVRQAVEFLYADYPSLPENSWVDFTLRVSPVGRFRWLRRNPEAQVFIGDFPPFPSFDQRISPAMLEWGMNWCIWLNVAHLIIFHAAMLEFKGNGLILAADSGEGKSTLAAGLSLAGWRLLSDELTLIDPDDTETVNGGLAVAKMVPIPRPICLKNESIKIVRDMFPQAAFSHEYPDTGKGLVAHVKPTADSVHRAKQRVVPRWIIFPKYVKGASPTWTPWEKAEAFIRLGQHGDAYSVLGKKGFQTLADVISHCDCWRFEYGNLEDAVLHFRELGNGSEPC
ncbi:MAG: HprK-related kinase A [Planctomycetia bacterium]|nr:HprK-related kinase A [Planctomycetia bacterium]